MTLTAATTQKLDLDACRNLPANTKVTVRAADGSIVETVTVQRYGGWYRDKGGKHTFAVKDANNKFRLRSDKELGLVGDMGRTCSVADEADIDLR